jgi:hypothetical protein
VRLHRAQLSFLSGREERSFASVMQWLHAFSQRMGRSFAHLCLLALVFVELRVVIPAEYSGLLSYIDSPAAEETIIGSAEMPQRLLTDISQDFDLSQGVDMPDLVLPPIMPDIVSPLDEPTSVET